MKEGGIVRKEGYLGRKEGRKEALDNIRVWHAPGPVLEVNSGNEVRRQTAEILREAFLASLRPDIIHVCSLFEGYVDDAVKKDSGVVIVVAPEGTRKKSPKWKSGFLRIAEKNNCKIQLGALDFPNKRIVLGDVFEPTGDNQADIAAIIEYYGQFKGKHPDQF